MTYRIALHGCDDSTYIWVNLSDSEFVFLNHIANLFCAASNYGCMPSMRIDTEPKQTELED